MPQKPRNKSKAPKRASRRDRLIRKALALVERRLDSDELNTSVADLIRLLELSDKERGDREVRATFVDPEEFET